MFIQPGQSFFNLIEMNQNMENMEGSQKISDSAYSNSCANSNSNSQRSASSKSRHSGSNSSGSSGYGGKPSTSSTSNADPQLSKRHKEKDRKKKKLKSIIQNQSLTIEDTSINESKKSEGTNDKEDQEKSDDLNKENLPKDEQQVLPPPPEEDIVMQSSKSGDSVNVEVPPQSATKNEKSIDNGFCCVISMHDGVVLYTTPSITDYLHFPKDMWLGRSFIDFVHPKDRSVTMSDSPHPNNS